MSTSVSAKGLVRTIERRLAAISDQQHALAVERTRLLEHVTPLRLGRAGAGDGARPPAERRHHFARGRDRERAASRRSRDRAGCRAVARSAVASLVSDAVSVEHAESAHSAQRPCPAEADTGEPIAAHEATALAAGSHGTAPAPARSRDSQFGQLTITQTPARRRAT